MMNHQQKCSALYHKSEDLKRALQGRLKTPLKDPNVFQRLQEFIEVNKKLLIIDLEYALDKKSEVELWNFGFKEAITSLQIEANSRSILDKEKKSCAQASHTWFLELATGFYVVLLQEICVIYDLDLPFLRSAGFYGVASDLERLPETDVRKVENVANITYIVAHCLIHLGDLSRYRGMTKQAENFYKHCLKVAPASGHGYNQLGLLEVSRNGPLNAIFFYVRALALKCPFPAASSNLSRMYSKILQDSSKENMNFKDKFLVIQAQLHTVTQLKKAKEASKELIEQLTEMIASDNIPIKDLIKILSILIFHTENSFVDQDSSNEEQYIFRVQIDLLAGLFNAVLMPVHTVKQGQALLDFSALPLIKLILDWIAMNPQVLEHPGFLMRPHIWPSLAKVFNDLASKGHQDKNELFPLPEEFDLQAFLPLSDSLQKYNFRQILKGATLDAKVIKAMRASRILKQGQKMSDDEWTGRKVLKKTDDKYEASEEEESGVIADYLQDLIIAESSSEIEDQHIDAEEDKNLEESQKDCKKKTKNVAMEAILRQVTFKTPSPNFSEDSESQPSSNISQEDPSILLQARGASYVPGYLRRTAQAPNPSQNVPLQMDFSVPPPNLNQQPRLSLQPAFPTQPLRLPPQLQALREPGPSNWPRPEALPPPYVGPSYQLFAGNSPSFSPFPLGNNQERSPANFPNAQVPPPSSNNPRPPMNRQNFLFQPGPSPLEKLLRQNPKSE